MIEAVLEATENEDMPEEQRREIGKIILNYRMGGELTNSTLMAKEVAGLLPEKVERDECREEFGKWAEIYKGQGLQWARLLTRNG